MSTDGVRLTPEWALWGKDPQERDFRLLRCSDVRLGRHDFSEIISRYSPGTHTDLPQVAISWTRLGDEIYLGFAIQEWSSEGDRLGRDIAVTRYFGVPYFQLRRPISYVDLYEALATYDAASGEPISVPGLDPHRIAARAARTRWGRRRSCSPGPRSRSRARRASPCWTGCASWTPWPPCCRTRCGPGSRR
ncbi:hypothetical protein ACFQY7_26375 [Actinomadura luteofluorescens]|uniref:hypothetical protein n=1 Tax=Actinomadura luteofluorescens TaxID=46163 RepID=UPI00362CE32C